METTTQDPTALPNTVQEIEAWMADASPAAVEAMAGWWLRELGQVSHELAQTEARRGAEMAMVERHYGAIVGPLTIRIADLHRCLQALAERITLPKNRKTVQLAWGDIGRKTVPERVAVADPDAALATIRDLLPSAVRVKESVDVKAATPAVLAAIADGVDVPGFEHIPTHEAPVVKINGAIAAGVDA
jgi:phage host-nuclease inhibitor protein Gam